MTSSEVTTYALHSLAKSDLRDVVLETIPGFLVTSEVHLLSGAETWQLTESTAPRHQGTLRWSTYSRMQSAMRKLLKYSNNPVLKTIWGGISVF